MRRRKHRISNSVKLRYWVETGRNWAEVRWIGWGNGSLANKNWRGICDFSKVSTQGSHGWALQGFSAHFCFPVLAPASSVCVRSKQDAPNFGLCSSASLLKIYYFCRVLKFLAYGLPWWMLVNSVSLLPGEKEPQWPTITTALMWGLCFGPVKYPLTNEQKWPKLY